MKSITSIRALKLWVLLLLPLYVKAQSGRTSSNPYNSKEIITAVPFLTVAPDARSGAMGDAGAAVSPDANATYWNPSKLAFMDSISALSVSYSPWLKHLISTANLSYLSYVKKIDKRNTLAASVRYFSIGTVYLYDDYQNATGELNPFEASVDGSLARKFGENFSLGLTLRYIYSQLTNSIVVAGQPAEGSSAFAADVSAYLKVPGQQLGADALLAFGLDISNIGSRISYSSNGRKYFLPTNLKFGVANTFFPDNSNELTFTLDLNKLLVPSPPVRDIDGNIIKGQEDDRSVVSAIFSSFNVRVRLSALMIVI